MIIETERLILREYTQDDFKELYEILSMHSGVDIAKIEQDADRDYWMGALEAKEYGLIDEVLSKRIK